MNLFRLKTVLFDLDGTLLDTAPDLAFALNKLLSEENLPPISVEKVREVASDGSPGLLGLAFHIDENHPNYQSYRKALLDTYQQHLCVNTKLFSGMDKVLAHLEQRGIRWGVVTNKPSQLAKELIHEINLADRCACIIGGGCTLRSKPFPDSLLLACEKTGSSPKECVYIGDAERDIEAAKYAGMRSVAALYGYLRSDSCPEFWHADYYIDQPQDIICWVERQLSVALI